MKTRTKMMFLAIMAAILIWNGLAFADDSNSCPAKHGPPPERMGDHRGPMGPGGPGMENRGAPGMILPFLLDKLDLTSEQNEKIHTIMDASRDNAEAARKAIEQASRVLHMAIVDGNDEATIRTAAAAVGKAIGDEAVLRAKTLTDIKKVLTSEQQEKLKEMLAKKPGRPDGPPPPPPPAD
jgi:Spy/CpxP family protein refolding chaperone